MQLYNFRTDHVFTAVLFLFRFRFGLFSFFSLSSGGKREGSARNKK